MKTYSGLWILNQVLAQQRMFLSPISSTFNNPQIKPTKRNANIKLPSEFWMMSWHGPSGSSRKRALSSSACDAGVQ